MNNAIPFYNFFNRNMGYKKLPGEEERFPILHKKVTDTTKKQVRIKDDQGRHHNATEESFTEAEIDNTHLVKIAPMFYFCPDNNRVLMIPFSIQFSVLEMLKLAAGMAINLEDRIDVIKKEFDIEQQKEQAAREAIIKEKVEGSPSDAKDTNVPTKTDGDTDVTSKSDDTNSKLN